MRGEVRRSTLIAVDLREDLGCRAVDVETVYVGWGLLEELPDSERARYSFAGRFQRRRCLVLREIGLE